MRKRKKPTIWGVFLLGMVVIFLTVGAVFMTTVYFSQTRKMTLSSQDLVEYNVEDVSADINDLAQVAILNTIERLYTSHKITSANIEDPVKMSEELREEYGSREVELNIIDRNGIIVASSNPESVGDDIHNNPNDQDFVELLEGNDYAGFQDERPSARNPSVLMRYVGARLPDGNGIIQLGIGQDIFHDLLLERSQFAVTNRRIGEDGYLMIADSTQKIINSFHNEHTGDTLEDAGISVDPSRSYEMICVPCTVYNEPSLICINEEQDEYIVGVYPIQEAEEKMMLVLKSALLLILLIFGALFLVLMALTKKLIANSIGKVNDSLEKITSGDIEEKVSVNQTYEFDLLSTDINKTVDRLKGYIAEEASRIDKDLQNAKTIQSSSLPNIFPPFPEYREFEIFASMTPAKEVGGDFYDFFMISSDTLGFLIADVSGKGIAGALFMMRSKSMIRTFAQSGLSPAEVFDRANENLCAGNESEMFVTTWMGYLNIHTGEVTVVNAGHNRPLRIRSGRAKYINSRTDLMLAGMEGTTYSQQKIALQPGDILYLYTDGVTEAMDPDLNQYGEHRLIQLLSFMENEPASSGENGITEAICQLVAEDVNTFVRDAEQSDDITMLCIRYLGDV